MSLAGHKQVTGLDRSRKIPFDALYQAPLSSALHRSFSSHFLLFSQHLVLPFKDIGSPTGRSCHYPSSVVTARSVIYWNDVGGSRLARRQQGGLKKKKKDEDTVVDGLQALILTIKRLSTKEPCGVFEEY